jgi:hypothetical protein
MGKFTRYVPLPDQSYDPRTTDLSNPVRPPVSRSRSGLPGGFVNKVISNTTPIQLVAGVPVRVLPFNQSRKGLLIQNRDTASPLYVGFGGSNGVNDLSIAAGGYLLLDFVCPPSELWLYSPTNLLAVVVDMSQTM